MKILYRFSALAAGIGILFSVCCFPADAAAISARAACVLEPSGGWVLYEKNADRQMPMASTTKIMTALTALSVLPTDATVAIPSAAVGTEGSSAYLEAGEKLTVLDLLYALLLQSANDAAVALAIAADGSTEAFAERMNTVAASLGLTHTHFVNPHGLPDDDHYTTAKELAKIAAAAMKDPVFRAIAATKVYTCDTSVCRRTFVNHNKLLRLCTDAIGIKTGFTKKSGRCLVGAAEKDGVTLISVTLNAPDDWNDHRQLWEECFPMVENRQLLSAGEYTIDIPVLGGTVPFVTVENRDALCAVVPKNGAPVRLTPDLPAFPTAPLTADGQLGLLHVYAGTKEIASLPLYIREPVGRAEYHRKKILGLF